MGKMKSFEPSYMKHLVLVFGLINYNFYKKEMRGRAYQDLDNISLDHYADAHGNSGWSLKFMAYNYIKTTKKTEQTILSLLAS